MPWQAVPAFYDSLSDGTVIHLALRFLMLTNLRSRPIRFCRLEEIEGNVWEVPADNMKSSKGMAVEFRVPLSEEAFGVIEQAKPFAQDGYLFPSVRKGVISDATMSRVMERRGLEARPHGFRSSFRTWCAEVASVPEHIGEAAMAHVTGTKVERAYRWTDFLDQRRALMERRAAHLTGHGAAVLRFTQ